MANLIENYVCETPDETFDLGAKIGESLIGGEVILLAGSLGAGKTLFTKGILDALDYDVDEVTSPSFSLVNLYKTDGFDVYHIDLWRIDERENAARAVGLGEIMEDETAVIIIEWSERLKNFNAPPEKLCRIKIIGDGDDARTIEIER